MSLHSDKKDKILLIKKIFDSPVLCNRGYKWQNEHKKLNFCQSLISNRCLYLNNQRIISNLFLFSKAVTIFQRETFHYRYITNYQEPQKLGTVADTRV